MNIHHLKVFCSVYKNRSFSRASEEMYLSQPTVSDHIKTLEETLGARLFDRLGRSIAPTPESNLLYPRAIEIIEKFNSLKGEVFEATDAPAGEILVGASSVPGTYFLPRAAADFKKLYPGISVKVVARNSKEIAGMIAGNELPLGIVSGIWERKCLKFMPLADDELVFAGSCDFETKGLATPEALSALPFVLREEGSGTRKEMEAALSTLGIPVPRLKITGTFESLPSVLEAVKSGLGISAFWRTSISDELKRGVLAQIKVKGFKAEHKFHIICHRKKTVPRPAQMFIEHLSMLIETRGPAKEKARGFSFKREMLKEIQGTSFTAEELRNPSEKDPYVKI
ncbi:MAG: LysR family transcriptional regulator [Actinomycetota bacterium]|nr:LysR family transcriptional regulator [Actinomycetota bacterium]